MDQLKIIEENILILIERLKELETLEYRKYVKNIEQYNTSRQFATEMFRTLLLERDRELNKLKNILPSKNWNLFYIININNIV